MHRQVLVVLVLAAAVLVLGACSGSTAPSTSSTFTGCSQPDMVTTWAVPVVVRANGKAAAKVTAAHYNDCEPVPNTRIHFYLHGVCGTLSVNSGVTDSKGLVATKYRASSKVGTCEICGSESGEMVCPFSLPGYPFPDGATVKQEAS
jgi:hypothetical protein